MLTTKTCSLLSRRSAGVSVGPWCPRRFASSMTSAAGAPIWVVSSLLLHVDDDGLEVGHLLARAIAADPADAALLPGAAAKRDMRFPVIGGLVDVYPSGLEPLRETQRTVDITRVDGAEQAIW